MKITLFRCFCTEDPHSGNIAGVVDATTIAPEVIQKAVKQLMLPVLTAIYPNEMRLRFFYPETEMPHCIHGTIAAVAWLSTQEKIILKNTQHQWIHAEKKNNVIKIKTTLITHAKEVINKKTVLELLGASEDCLHPEYYCGVASVGSPKLLIPVISLETFKTLQPNLDAIKTYSQNNSVNGVYVYTPETFSPNADFHARAFNPKTGNAEDAATGVAAAALAGVLKQNICIEQGHFIQCPSLIHVDYHHDEDIYVGGQVRFSEEYILAEMV